MSLGCNKDSNVDTIWTENRRGLPDRRTFAWSQIDTNERSPYSYTII